MEIDRRTVLRTLPWGYVRLLLLRPNHLHIGRGDQAFTTRIIRHLDPPGPIVLLQNLDRLPFANAQLIRRCRSVLEHHASPYDLW